MIPRPMNVNLSYRFLELIKESVLGNANLPHTQASLRSVTFLCFSFFTSESKTNSNRTFI